MQTLCMYKCNVKCLIFGLYIINHEVIRNISYSARHHTIHLLQTIIQQHYRKTIIPESFIKLHKPSTKRKSSQSTAQRTLVRRRHLRRPLDMERTHPLGSTRHLSKRDISLGACPSASHTRKVWAIRIYRQSMRTSCTRQLVVDSRQLHGRAWV
jgi:hypothetical protein